jgi:hypothetical protein
MRGIAGMAGAAVRLRHWNRVLGVSETEWPGGQCALRRHARLVQQSAEVSRMVVIGPGSPPLPRSVTPRCRWALCRWERDRWGERCRQRCMRCPER